MEQGRRFQAEGTTIAPFAISASPGNSPSPPALLLPGLNTTPGMVRGQCPEAQVQLCLQAHQHRLHSVNLCLSSSLEPVLCLPYDVTAAGSAQC
jgi:hypothetical protein